MRSMKCITAMIGVCLILMGPDGACQNASYPAWLKDSLKRKGLDAKFEPSAWLQPSFLQDDFNGDGAADFAVPVVEKATHKKGILLIQAKSAGYFVFGAGTKFGDGSDDFTWANKWSVYKKKTAYETQFDKKSGDVIGGKQIKLSHPCISVAVLEDGAETAGGLIYWTGTKYRWIHQGD